MSNSEGPNYGYKLWPGDIIEMNIDTKEGYFKIAKEGEEWGEACRDKS